MKLKISLHDNHILKLDGIESKWVEIVATNIKESWDLQEFVKSTITFLVLLIYPHYLKCNREMKFNVP